MDQSSRHSETETINSIINEIKKFNGKSVFPVLYGLVSLKQFHSSHFSLYNFTCLFLKYSRGKKNIKCKDICNLYKKLCTTQIKLLEDPPEDAFLLKLFTLTDEFFIFEGIWEASSFLLERFIEALESCPPLKSRNELIRSCNALLKLSHEVGVRSNAQVNNIYIDSKKEYLNLKYKDLLRLSKQATFTKGDLKRLNISLSDIQSFLLNINLFDQFDFPFNSKMTPLDLFPLIESETNKFSLFPQSVSSALRMRIIKIINEDKTFKAHFGKQYIISIRSCLKQGNVLHYPIILDTSTPPTMFPKFSIDEFAIRIYKSRILHIIILYDHFDKNVLQNGLMGTVTISSEELKIDQRINKIKESFSDISENSLTIVVNAFWGRASLISYELLNQKNWYITSFSIYDFYLLNQHPDIKLNDLWKIEKMLSKVEDLKITIFNMNGAANLIGWLQDNNWHIAPHEQLPEENNDSLLNIIIPNEYIAYFRVKVHKSLDKHLIQNIYGIPKLISKNSSSYFYKEDESDPLYISINDIDPNTVSGVYLSKTNWWIKVSSRTGIKSIYGFWEAISNWMKHIHCCLDSLTLNTPPVFEWEVEVEILDEQKDLSSEEITSIKRSDNLIFTKITILPNGIFNSHLNIGERNMVLSFLKAFNGFSDDELDNLINIIIPNENAKYFHLFRANTYTDYLSTNLPQPIKYREIDDSLSRLGLGWGNFSPSSFLKITDKEGAIHHLRIVVDTIWNKIQDKLSKLNKSEFCQLLLNNLASLENENSRWNRTIKACLSLHADKENVKEISTKEISKISANIIASRILCEMAICTCPIEGKQVDEIEFSELLSLAMLMYNVGSWSDGINGDLLPPIVKVSILGQIMMDYSFISESVEKYTLHINKNILDNHIDRYKKYYEKERTQESVQGLLEHNFTQSWKIEFGLTFDQTRKFIDIIEQIGIKLNQISFIKTHVDFVNEILSQSDFDQANLLKFINRLSLKTRNKWAQNKTELNHLAEPSDWYPWCFKRKLSLLSKPILELSNSHKPELLIAPSIIKESLHYLMRNSYEANFDEKFFYSKEMQNWIGQSRHKEGQYFNTLVSNKMKELNWESISDVKLTEILNMKLTQDFGDVDVLAWNKKKNVILAIECKDMVHAKTFREMANQINEFLGKLNKKGKRDKLLRHFDRLDQLSKFNSNLLRFTNRVKSPNLIGLLVFRNKNIVQFTQKIPQKKISILSFKELEDIDNILPKLPVWS